MEPGYTAYQNSGDVPTLNLPQQYDPTIGQVSQAASTEIIRSQGQTQVSDPSVTPVAQEQSNTAIPAAETEPGPKSLASSTGSLPLQPTQTTRSDKKRYAKGMVLEGKVHVGDGHSLLVGEDPVRLNGIEAPGLKQLCFSANGTAWRCGQAAGSRLKTLAEGKKAICHVDAPAGEGAAATCTVQGISDVGRLLVEEGLAVTNRYGPSVYSIVQSQARHDKIGLWVGTFQSPAEWRKKNR